MIKPAHLKKYHFTYKILRNDGKFYLGFHSTDNMDDGYMGSGKYILNSIKKYGIKNHTRLVLQQFNSREEARLHEREIVNEECLKDERCMNMQLGGIGGSPFGAKLSDEARLNMRNAKIGKKLSEKHCESLSKSLIGKKHSEERNKKKSEAMKGKPNLSGVKLQKQCTIDGVNIYPSVAALTAALGYGRNGIKSPNLRFINEQ